MQPDDLTRVKYIGPARMKILNAQGIVKISQLVAIPLDTLSRMKSIGAFYGKGIKDAAMAIGRPPRPDRSLKGGRGTQEPPPSPLRSLRKQMERIRRELARLDCPPSLGGPTQTLIRFADYKKASDRLSRDMEVLLKNCGDLSETGAKTIARKAKKVKKELKAASLPAGGKQLARLARRLTRLSDLLREQAPATAPGMPGNITIANFPAGMEK